MESDNTNGTWSILIAANQADLDARNTKCVVNAVVGGVIGGIFCIVASVFFCIWCKVKCKREFGHSVTEIVKVEEFHFEEHKSHHSSSSDDEKKVKSFEPIVAKDMVPVSNYHGPDGY